MSDVRNPQQFKHYLRVGDPPKSGRSANYVTGEPERGISVYDLDEHGQPVVPPEDEWGELDLRERLASEDPKHLVTGEEVGVGQGGEPLLRNMKIVGVWSKPDD